MSILYFLVSALTAKPCYSCLFFPDNNLFVVKRSCCICCCSPGGIPARNSKGERLLLYAGIIDILQSYRLKKRLEHAMKAMVHDGVRITASDLSPQHPFTEHKFYFSIESSRTPQWYQLSSYRSVWSVDWEE